MGRHSCCYKQKLRKGLWSPDEDEKLLNHINKYGHGCWSSVPKKAGLQRCGKSCRLRWINYLRPDLKRGTFSQEEENLIIKLHAVLGNRWSQIAAQLPGRTDNEIKNFWNSSIKKRLRQRGIDPNTHKPIIAENECGEDQANTMSDKTSDSNKLDIFSPNSATSVSLFGEQSQPQFIDQFITNQERSSSSWPLSNSMGFFPFSQSSFPESPNPVLYFNQNTRGVLDINSELNCNAMSTVHPSVSRSFLSTMDDLKPMINMASDNTLNSSPFWESASTCNNSQNNRERSTGIELQNDIFSASDLMQDKGAQETDQDLKWSECLDGAFPISAALQNHNEALYGF